MIDWHAVFDEEDLSPPATPDELARLQDDLVRPLSEREVEAVLRSQSNPWPSSHPLHMGWQPMSPAGWSLPGVPLPGAYLDFLRRGNGGWTRRGQREFSFFPSSQVREFLLSYGFPRYMPCAIPLGLDGSGLFAVFDARRGPAAEYPVLVVAAGVLDFAESALLGAGFAEFCAGSTPLADVLDPPDPEAAALARPVDVVLVRRPDSLASLLALRERLALDLPPAALLAMARELPRVLLSRVPRWRGRRCIEGLPPELQACLRIVDEAPGAALGEPQE